MSFLNKYNRAEDNTSHNAAKIGSAIYRIGELIHNGEHCNFITKLDQNGIVIWEKSYFYAGHKVYISQLIECDSNGEFLIFGSTGTTTNSVYLFRINGNGVVLWNKQINNNFPYQILGDKATISVISLGNENYVVALTDKSEENYGSIILIKFNQSGTITAQKRITVDDNLFYIRGMVKGSDKFALYGTLSGPANPLGDAFIIELNFNLTAVVNKIASNTTRILTDLIYKNQDYYTRSETQHGNSFLNKFNINPSNQINLLLTKLFIGTPIWNLKYNNNFIYVETYEREWGVFTKIDYDLSVLWTKRYNFVDMHPALGIMCQVKTNEIIILDGEGDSPSFGNATIGSFDLDFTSCRTIDEPLAALDHKYCGFVFSEAKVNLLPCNYGLFNIESPQIQELVSEKIEICPPVIENPCIKDLTICELYSQLLAIQGECLLNPDGDLDIISYQDYINCFNQVMELMLQFIEQNPNYGLGQIFQYQIKSIIAFTKNPTATFYLQAWFALEFILGYLAQLGNCNCENTFTETDNTAIQSGHLYLQSAGSVGDESTKGIHLRWMFRDKLAWHLPKANYAANTYGFNKPNDFVKIFRAPYSENKTIIDFASVPDMVNDGSVFPQKHWVYNVNNHVFYIYFRNTQKYNQVRQTVNPNNDPYDFIKNYGNSLIEVENKTQLSFAVSANFEDIGSPAKIKLELLSVAVNKITAPKTAGFRKEFEMNELNQEKLFSENIRSVRFVPTNAVLRRLEFELYSEFIKKTKQENGWSFISKLALTKNTFVAYDRLEPQINCLNHWFHFNEEAFVNVANYKNRWNGNTAEPMRNMNHIVDKYIDLSDDVTNPQAVESVLLNTSTEVQDCMLSNPNYLPDPNSNIDVSYLNILQIASLDYHNARMLGLGVLDLNEQVLDGKYIYMAEYHTLINLNDGMTEGPVQHLYCSLPTSLNDQRLPDAIDIASVTPGIDTIDEGSSFEHIDEEGYTSDRKARYFSIFNTPIHKEIANSNFYYTDFEFRSSEKTVPIFVGLEYKKSSEANWRKPELSHDFIYFDTNDIPETKVILIPPLNRPFYIHREKQSGLHKYCSYGINWFSRSKNSELVKEIETVLRPGNDLLPPTNVNALLIKKESPLALTSLNEQIMFNAIPDNEDRTLIRLTFDYNHGQELKSYHYKINDLVVKDYYEVADQKEPFADDIEVYFRNRVPLVVTGKIHQVLPTGNPVLVEVTTQVYGVQSSGVNENVPPTNPPTYNEMYTPVIPAGEENSFLGSILVVDGIEFAIDSVDNSGTYPKFTVFKADPNGEEVTFETIITSGNVLLTPNTGSLFNTVENMQNIPAWETPNPYPFNPQNAIHIDHTTVYREEVIRVNPDCNNDTHVQKFRGIFENAIIEKVKEKIDENHDGEYDLTNPSDPESFVMKHQGIYKITFPSFSLAQHSQYHQTDFSVEFSTGIVRLHTYDDPQGPRKELKVIKAENIGVAGTDLILHVCDLSFPTNLSQVAAYSGKIMAVNDDSPIMQTVNYYPSYKVYFTDKTSFGFTEANLLPIEEEDFNYSVFGLRSHDYPNEVIEDGIVVDNIIDYYSRMSQPAFMFAQANIEPEQPDRPMGGQYATRPDFFGKSSYTFTTQFTHKPYSVQFNRASDIQILATLYNNEKTFEDNVQINYPNTVQNIMENIFLNGEELFYINMWDDLLDFDESNNNLYPQLFDDGNGHTAQLPLPDNPNFLGGINAFIEAHNDFYNNLPIPINPINIATLNYETIIIPLVNNPDGTIRNAQLKFRDFVRDVVFNCFVPLTEIPVIYKLIKGQPDFFPDYKPIPKKQLVRDRNGNLLPQNDPAFDMAPMMRVIATNKTQFTDFGLDGASNAKYFYAVREFNSQLKTGPYSQPVGPISLVNSAPPTAPEIIKVIPVLEDRVLGVEPCIQLQINAYNKIQNIKKINIYRADNANDSLSIRTMKLVKEIDFDIEDLQDQTQWIFTDDFADLPQVPFADPLYYKVTVSRKIKYNDKDGQTVIDYAPSEASKMVLTNIVATYSPESPVLNYTADLYNPATDTSLDYITLSWEHKVYKGNYHLYKMSPQGNWVEIIRVIADRVTKGMYHFYNQDAQGNWVNTLHPEPLIAFNDILYLPLELTDLATSTLPTKTIDNKPIYHHLKVLAENTAGMQSKEQKILTLYNADSYHYFGGIASDTGEEGMIVQGDFIVRHN